MSVYSRLLLAAAACLLTLAGCGSGSTGTGSSKEGVAATVNGTPVSENLLDYLLKQRAELGRPVTDDVRSGMLDRLVMQLLVSEEAVKKGLDKSPEVAAQIEMSRHSILANAFIQDYAKNNPVSDEAASAEYEKMKAQSSGMEYKARHILLEQEAEAKAVIASLKKNPKLFESLAREKSRDTGSKANGGELGWFDPRRMVPEFGAAVAKLSKGNFTEEPVKSQFGYHVILLEDSRPIAMHPLEQMKPALKQQLQQQNLQKYLDGLKAQAKIDIKQAAASAPGKDAGKPEAPKR
jgi:peptidyl-prolyl cis-trans isomerase C